jgi:hypothetical protein
MRKYQKSHNTENKNIFPLLLINNMSATLVYLNMPKRRKQSKQNRKLVQEAMNRKKEMKTFEKVVKPTPTSPPTFCTIM